MMTYTLYIYYCPLYKVFLAYPFLTQSNIHNINGVNVLNCDAAFSRTTQKHDEKTWTIFKLHCDHVHTELRDTHDTINVLQFHSAKNIADKIIS